MRRYRNGQTPNQIPHHQHLAVGRKIPAAVMVLIPIPSPEKMRHFADADGANKRVMQKTTPALSLFVIMVCLSC